MKKALVIILSLIMILVMIPVSTGVATGENVSIDPLQHDEATTNWSLKDNILYVFGHRIIDNISSEGIWPYTDRGAWLNYTHKVNEIEYKNRNFSDVIHRIVIDVHESKSELSDTQDIGSNAFYGCKLVNEVYIIGSTITHVGTNAFFEIGSTTTPCNLAFQYEKWPITDDINGEKCTFADTGLIYWAGGVFKAGNGTKEHPWHIGKNENDDVTAYISGTDLFIDGSGEMRDFDIDKPKQPFWYDKRDTIQEVHIGNEVTSIGAKAFYNDTETDRYVVKRIFFEDNCTLETIGDYAFADCIQLEEFIMPDSVKAVGESTFNGCTSLTNLVISSNLTTVGTQALYGLNNLKTVTFNGAVPDSIRFGSTGGTVDLYLPLDYLAIATPSSTGSEWHGAKFRLIPSGTAEHPWYIGKPASGSNVPTSMAQAYISGTDLIITGTGETIDFGEGYLVTDTNKIPWKASASNITKVNISEGITNIGEQSFSGIGTTPPCNIVVPGNLITQTQSGTPFTFKGGTFDASDYFTVTFDSEGGSAVDSAIVGPLEDHKVAIPVDPTMNGYLFDGWYRTNENELWNFNTPLVTDTTLHAKWTQSYKATVKLGGGAVSTMPSGWSTISGGYSKNFRINTSYTDILGEWNGKISRSGYTFDGWDISTGTLSTDTSFTAKWKQNSTGGYYYIPPVDNKKNDEKLKEAEEKAKLKEEILFAQVEASSKLYKLNGKTAIKITWDIESGDLKLADLDNYEIFRSTKKNSGYGKKPYFTSSKPDYGYYINNKGLKKGKTYYYKVRGFKVIDGEKYYTPWSTKCWRTVK